MEISPLHMNITLNQEGNGAIFHINCQSDGERTKWKEDKQEAGGNALRDWLNTLGCLLKIHGTTEYTFSDPWVYSISNFPKNYKLFTLERKRVGDNPPKKDHYLYGGKNRYRSPQEYYPHLHWLLNNTRGVNDPCICQYCDKSREQEEINEIFPLPPRKEGPAKGPRGSKKHKQTKKQQNPKRVTGVREIKRNRNSLTTGLVITSNGTQKVIGYKTRHRFRS